MKEQLRDAAYSKPQPDASDLSRRHFGLSAVALAFAAACDASPLSAKSADDAPRDCPPSTHCAPCKDPAPVLENCFYLTDNGITHRVCWQGDGPAVVLMHELPGMTPAFLRLAWKIVHAGFRVYAPLFFGHPNQWSVADGIFSTVFCVRHEFNVFTANGNSPVAQWLRALCRRADQECGNRGVGLIGLCLTGSIVLSVMIEPSVRVPVMCEPALPFFDKSALGIPEDDICKAKQRAVFSPILAYRFSTDEKSPHERFVTLRETFGPNISAKEICTGVAPFEIPKCAHSVLTGNYPDQDNVNHPVQQAFDEILARFRTKLDV